MTLTIDLTPELEARLKAAAAAQGTDEATAVLQALEAALPQASTGTADRLLAEAKRRRSEAGKLTTGAETAAYLTAIPGPSVFARFGEDDDAIARRLREQAERRNWNDAA